MSSKDDREIVALRDAVSGMQLGELEIVRLQRLLERIANLALHAPNIAGESNVQHAQHCIRCLADARGAVKLRV